MEHDALVLLHAPIGELLRLGDQVATLTLVVGGDVDLGEIRVVLVDAVDVRLAEAGAARVPTDDVEAVEQTLVEDLLGVEREVAAAEPGPARVDEQRPDAMLGVVGEPARHEEFQCPGRRVVVVDRGGHPRRLGERIPGLPVDVATATIPVAVGSAGSVGRGDGGGRRRLLTRRASIGIVAVAGGVLVVGHAGGRFRRPGDSGAIRGGDRLADHQAHAGVSAAGGGEEHTGEGEGPAGHGGRGYGDASVLGRHRLSWVRSRSTSVA